MNPIPTLPWVSQRQEAWAEPGVCAPAGYTSAPRTALQRAQARAARGCTPENWYWCHGILQKCVCVCVLGVGSLVLMQLPYTLPGK
jgi:hypothetical protein